MLTYVCVRSASRQGLFRALHRNIALSELAFGRAFSSTMFLFRRRSNENSERALLDTMLSRSEWSRQAKLSQAACRLLKVGGDRVSAEGWTVVRRQCAI